MVDNDTVIVYSFRVLDGHAEDFHVAPFKATRGAIERMGIEEAELIEGTAEAVGREDLDAAGRYRRVPTGWGGLS